jgi:hypothetical protein
VHLKGFLEAISQNSAREWQGSQRLSDLAMRQATTACDISKLYEKTAKAIVAFRHCHPWPAASGFQDAQHLDFFAESLKP